MIEEIPGEIAVVCRTIENLTPAQEADMIGEELGPIAGGIYLEKREQKVLRTEAVYYAMHPTSQEGARNDKTKSVQEM